MSRLALLGDEATVTAAASLGDIFHWFIVTKEIGSGGACDFVHW